MLNQSLPNREGRYRPIDPRHCSNQGHGGSGVSKSVQINSLCYVLETTGCWLNICRLTSVVEVCCSVAGLTSKKLKSCDVCGGSRELSSQDPDADADVEQTGPIIWNYYRSDGVQSNRGGAKYITCSFCDTPFTRCPPSRAYARILGRAVLGQKRLNIGVCILICEDNENSNPQFKIAQTILNK